MIQVPNRPIACDKMKATFMEKKKTFAKAKVFFTNLVTRMGFEPMNVAVKGRCVKPLHQRASLNT